MIADVGAAYLAYFVTNFDRSTVIWRDWFGRPLTDTPRWSGIVCSFDYLVPWDLWPGWSWFAADVVAFWGVIGVAYWLGQYAMAESKESATERGRGA